MNILFLLLLLTTILLSYWVLCWVRHENEWFESHESALNMPMLFVLHEFFNHVQIVNIIENVLPQSFMVPLVSHYATVYSAMWFEMQLKVTMKQKKLYLYWMRLQLTEEYRHSSRIWNATVTTLSSLAFKGMVWSYQQHLGALHIP